MSKRDAILAATLKLLAGKGFHGFSIKQVADAAGVAAGTVYLYFRDREHLIQELHDEMTHYVLDKVSAGHDCNLSLFEQYQRICLCFWQLFMQQPDILLSKLQFDHLPSDPIRQSAAECRKQFSPLSMLFESGRAQGVLKPLPNEILFVLGLEPCFALALKHIVGAVTINDEMLETVIRATWDGICIRNPEPV